MTTENEGNRQVAANEDPAIAASNRLRDIAFMSLFEPVCEYRDGVAVITIKPSSQLRSENSKRLDVGAVVAVLDQVAGVAVWSEAGALYPMATLSFSATFTRPVPYGPVQAKAKIKMRRGALVYIELSATSNEEGGEFIFGHATFLLGAFANVTSDREMDPLAPETGGWRSCRSFAESVKMQHAETESILRFEPWLIGAPDPPSLHGGVLISASIRAGEAHIGTTDRYNLASVSMEFLKGGQAEDVRFTPDMLQTGRRTRTLSVSGEQSNGRLISTAFLRFTLE